MQRLFVYGSLQPGGPNAHVLGRLSGRWAPGALRGSLVQAGWGADLGYPGLVLDEVGDEIHGYVFSSVELEAEWERLDTFEGDGYERVLASVRLADGEHVRANVYVLRDRVPAEESR